MKTKNYQLLGDLTDEKDVLYSFENEYDGDMYICDVISEISDSQVPIYTYDIWENAKNVREYIESAIEDGLTEGVTDIEKIMQMGYYQYYQQSLYDNLDAMVYNIMTNKIVEFLNTLTEDELAEIDLESIQTVVEYESDGYDNNNRMDEITDKANEIIQEIKDLNHDL